MTRPVLSRSRAVYLAGLPYSQVNARLLHRALYWAAGAADRITELGLARDARVDVAWYPETGRRFVYNGSPDPVDTVVDSPSGEVRVELGPGESRWLVS